MSSELELAVFALVVSIVSLALAIWNFTQVHF